jgi:hypothetical protein
MPLRSVLRTPHKAEWISSLLPAHAPRIPSSGILRIHRNAVFFRGSFEEHLFFRTITTTYPLSNVNHAEVALDDGHSHVFYLAMNSGERIPVGGGWTPRKGYYQAADAVNQFMSHSSDIERRSGNSLQPPAFDFNKKVEAARKAFVEQSDKSQTQSKQ